MQRTILKTTWIVLGLMVVCVVGRLLPHPPNLTPMAAGALFAGFLLRNRLAALSVPLVSMLITDFIIGAYDLRIMAVTYAALMLPVFLRPLARGRFQALRVGGCSLGCTAVFFLATNLAVWAFSGSYSHSSAGLIACYVSALPFLGYTLFGDLAWNLAFFGGHGLLKSSSSIVLVRRGMVGFGR